MRISLNSKVEFVVCTVESGLSQQMAGVAYSVSLHGWTYRWHSAVWLLIGQVCLQVYTSRSKVMTTRLMFDS